MVKGTGGDGSSAQCTSYITVLDKTAPSLTVSASPSVLRPVNEKLRAVQLAAHATDACDPQPKVSCQVTSNEPIRHRHHDDEDDCNRDRWGRKVHKDRDDRDDDIIWKNGQLFLRADANEKSDRVYTIACTATDAGGNGVTGTATVTVPREHDRDR